VSDLRQAEILDDLPEDKLMAIIVNSNAQKLRYKLKDTDEGMYIQAYTKEKRKALTESVGNARPPPGAGAAAARAWRARGGRPGRVLQ